METFSALLALCEGNSPVDPRPHPLLPEVSDAKLWCFLRSAPEQTFEQTIETQVNWSRSIRRHCNGEFKVWSIFRICYYRVLCIIMLYRPCNNNLLLHFLIVAKQSSGWNALMPAWFITVSSNERQDISTHLSLHSLFRMTSKGASELHIPGLCEGKHGWWRDSSHKRPIMRKVFHALPNANSFLGGSICEICVYVWDRYVPKSHWFALHMNTWIGYILFRFLHETFYSFDSQFSEILNEN